MQVYLVKVNAAGLFHNAIKSRIANADGLNLLKILRRDECPI
jgi:hypothetical protein